MDLSNDVQYKPRHHHLARRQGSATGGISQIFCNDENEPTANILTCRPVTAKRNSYAERNEKSTIFDFGSSSPAAERPSTGRGRVPGAATFSQITLTHEEPTAADLLILDEQPSEAEQPRSNPIFGGNFKGLSVRQSVDSPLARPTTSSQRSMRDPNRSSVTGGIFGTDAGADDAPPWTRATPRRHQANEEAQPAHYGAKRMGANGRMQYFA
jgi:hypothetical protein